MDRRSITVKTKLNDVLNAMTKGKVKMAKDEQVEAVTAIFEGKDTVAILPTGYGKSMIFMTLPPLYHHMSASGFYKLKKVNSPLVIVISPLLSLMEVHVKEATSLGLSALQLPSPA